MRSFASPKSSWGCFRPWVRFLYPRVIGPRRTMGMLLTGYPINAFQTQQMGLVNRVVPREKLKETVDALVKRISEQSGPVLTLLKRVVFEGTWRPFDEALKRAQDLYLNQLFELQDSQEGLRALIEKRKPVWKNR